LTVIGVAVGVGFAVGLFLVFFDLDRSRRRSAEAELAVQATADVSGHVYVPAAPPRAVGIRERLNRVMQPAAERISTRGAKRGKPSLADQLAKADIKLRPSEFLMIQVGCVVAGALIGWIRFGIGPQFLLMAVAAYFAPGRYVKYRQGKRLRTFNNQLGDTLVLLANALKTGYSFPQALDVVAKKGSAPISTEFARVVREMNLGTSADDALAKLVTRVESADMDLVVSAVAINQSIGGNLAEILENISSTIRDRVRIKGEIRTLTAQARASGYIITALPILLAVFMYFVTPTYFKPMLSNPVGWIMLGVGAGLIGLGQTIIRKIVAIKV